MMSSRSSSTAALALCSFAVLCMPDCSRLSPVAQLCRSIRPQRTRTYESCWSHASPLLQVAHYLVKTHLSSLMLAKPLDARTADTQAFLAQVQAMPRRPGRLEVSRCALFALCAAL